MSHDDVIYMGSHGSNVLESDNWSGSASTFKAGLCCHLDDDGDLDLAAAAGGKLGISLGKSLSDHNRITVARKGKSVPILLDTGFEPTIGAQVQIHATSGLAVASGTPVNAIYVTGKKSAVDEDGAVITDGAARIDFIGGL